MRFRSFSGRWLFMVNLALGISPSGLFSQAPPQTSDTRIPSPRVIADAPLTIDPTQFLAPKLTKKVTRDFEHVSIREVVTWLQQDLGIATLVDKREFDAAGISLSDPIVDRLQDEPVYLLLNRLSALHIAWYYDDDVLHLTTPDRGDAHTTTVSFAIGALLDDGYEMESLVDVIGQTIRPESWSEVGGDGDLSSLGDVLFVRATDEVHRDIRALHLALQEPARRTFVNSSAEHLAIRTKLQTNVDVNFAEVPLEQALPQFSQQTGLDIRLDPDTVREKNVRPRDPLTLKLNTCTVATALTAITSDLGLTWTLRDATIWITSPERADANTIVAVYDVRDLCNNPQESEALIDAITSQVAVDSWDAVGGNGAVEAAKMGVLVILQTEEVHNEVLRLLESYRNALRTSKPRPHPGQDANEVITVYYRMHSAMADDLQSELPLLVSTNTWKVMGSADAVGTIVLVRSEPNHAHPGNTDNEAATDKVPAALNLQSVLIVQQTRAVHREIAKVIDRIRTGDRVESETEASNRGMMGGMGRGIGIGGMFDVTPTESTVNDVRAGNP